MSPVLAGLILAPIMANVTARQSSEALNYLLATIHDMQPSALLTQRESVGEDWRHQGA
jgi:hypothetical protein